MPDHVPSGRGRKPISRYRLYSNLVCYTFLLPCLLYYLVFHYGPMYGTLIAFLDYNPFAGLLASPWVGLKHFTAFFEGIYFARLVRNTLLLNFYSILFGFPMPILFALLLNEVRSNKFRTVTQTVSYIPHFISTVVVVGLLITFLSPSTGIIGVFQKALGREPVNFFGDPKYFRPVYVISGIWQNLGWGSIIYYAGLTSISPSLYEAADMDGAGRLRKIWHISLPGLIPTIVTMLLLDLGRIMNVGFEKVFLMQNSSIYETADVISTYVYRTGLQRQQFSYASAVGLFNSAVSLALILFFNTLARRISGSSLW